MPAGTMAVCCHTVGTGRWLVLQRLPDIPRFSGSVSCHRIWQPCRIDAGFPAQHDRDVVNAGRVLHHGSNETAT
jgi:hypothetical protein